MTVRIDGLRDLIVRLQQAPRAAVDAAVRAEADRLVGEARSTMAYASYLYNVSQLLSGEFDDAREADDG